MSRNKSPSFLKRLYRVRRLGALALCLPPILFTTIYAWRAYSRIDNYRRATDQQDVALTPAMFQLALFDTFKVDARRSTASPPPDPPTLPVFYLQIKRENWETLAQSGDIEDERPYVKAKLAHNDQLRNVEVRLRGGRYWHTDQAQKSLKIKLDKGDLVDGHRVFNLINDPTPMVIGEHIILELAAELGVLTPTSSFARLRVNDTDLGVFHYETQPDESLLRTNRRIPGSVYSGDLPDSAQTKELWAGTERWKKVSARSDSEEDVTNMDELARFLGKVASASHREFDAFAKEELNLGAFASIDVLNVAFGGDQHDFRENHKYYFDPYKSQFEPIAWSFRGFRSDPRFNLVENPILIRLKMMPDYLELRDRKLYEFLMEEGSPAAVRDRGMKAFVRLAPELKADPFWDAYRLLPNVDGFYRNMVRPMDLERAALVFEAELTTYRSRHAQLVRALERNPLFARAGTSQRITVTTQVTGTEGELQEVTSERVETPVDIVINGRGGVRLSSVVAEFPKECADQGFEVRRNDVVVGSGKDRIAAIDENVLLRPAVGLVERSDANERKSQVETKLVPADYHLTLRSDCVPERVSIQGFHLTSGSRVRSQTLTEERERNVPPQWPSPDDVPLLEVGQLGPHPSALETTKEGLVEFGPGDVTIRESRVFPPGTEVLVHAGTTIHLAAETSLIFRGKVRFEGTRSAPIVVGPIDDTWGGIALKGPETAGSVFRHTTISAGTVTVHGLNTYPAMLSLHDTSDITVEDCRIGETPTEADAIHAAYVKNLTVTDTEFVNTGGDALDLEFTTADINRALFVNLGDEALDLMGTQVNVADTVILGAGGSGVSAGEESKVTLRSVFIADAKVGVLAKNASDVWLTGSVLYRNANGVRVYTREVRYAGASHVRASVLYVVDSEKEPVKRQDKKRDNLDQGRVLESLPQEGIVDHLRDNVLQIENWTELPTWVDAEKRQAVL